MRRSGLTPVLAAFLVAFSLSSLPARAGEIDDATFGQRMTGSISRLTRYADVSGMGGASAGSRWASSANPSGSGWSPAVGSQGIGTSLQYSGIFFDEGTDVHLLSASAAFETEGAGVFQPGLLTVWSNRATLSNGLDFEWDAFYAELQWGLKISEEIAIGANLNFTHSEMKFSLGSTDVTKSEGDTYGVRIGGLCEASKVLYLGLALDYGINPSRSETYDFMGLGTGTEKERDKLDQLLIRPGLSFVVTEDLTINFDYQFGLFHDGDGTFHVHRFYAGFDQTVIEGVYLRGGAVLDTEGNFSPAVGLGIATSESFMLDLSWQHDLFPEIEEEFGKANVFSVAVTLLF
jgi:hypothetical protein